MNLEIPDALLDQVADVLAGRLVDAIADRLEQRAEARQGPWMTMDELVEYCKLSRSTVKTLVARGEIPRHGDGKALFHRSEVDDALLGYSRRPPTQLRRAV